MSLLFLKNIQNQTRVQVFTKRSPGYKKFVFFALKPLFQKVSKEHQGVFICFFQNRYYREAQNKVM
jgi:hypothetical protein